MRPTAEMATRLLAVYRERVDPIYKILHWPDVHSFLNTHYSAPSLELSPDHRALESAMHFTALCTLVDGEVDGRAILVEQYRVAAEWSLVQAGLLSTRSLVTLQAFVIYLVSNILRKPYCCLLVAEYEVRVVRLMAILQRLDFALASTTRIPGRSLPAPYASPPLRV